MSAEAAKSIDQLLDGIDHDRTLIESAARDTLLQKQQAKEKALQEAWDRAESMETSIKDFLAIADPVITEGLSMIGRRTWGDDGFIIFKYGPSWKKDGSYESFQIIGSSPITSATLMNHEAAEPPQYLSGAEFNFHAQGMDKSKAPTYDPDAAYYKATLTFRDGKPYSLQFGYGTTLYEEVLKMIGQENVLADAYAQYYRHGPEVHSSVSSD